MDKQEDCLDRMGGETQAMCLKALKLMELSEDVNHGAHQVECYESDGHMEDGHKLGLHEKDTAHCTMRAPY